MVYGTVTEMAVSKVGERVVVMDAFSVVMKVGRLVYRLVVEMVILRVVWTDS